MSTESRAVLSLSVNRRPTAYLRKQQQQQRQLGDKGSGSRPLATPTFKWSKTS